MSNSLKNLAWPERIALGSIRAYQLLSPPLKQLMGGVGCCRFTPSCSHYAAAAIREHGLGHGSILTGKRLLRCQPWGTAGYDPVPAKPACERIAT
jgi:uncharacterized protein